MASAFSSAAEALALVEADKHPGPMVLGEGELNPEVMVVKRSPSYADHKGGKPLLGQDGLPVRKALLQSNVSYYCTNAFPFVTQGSKVNIAQARQYAAILSEEIARVQPETVVLLGADAARWTSDFPIPFKKHNEVLGRIFEADGKRWAVAKAAGAISSVPSEFRSFLELVAKLVAPDPGGDDAEAPRETYRAVVYPQLARTLLRALPPRAALDIETDGLDPYTCNILTVQVSGKEGTGYAFPWDIMTPAEWAQALAGRAWVFQNGSYDVKVLAANGVFLRIAEDTMIMHSLIDETPGTHSMEQMAYRYLGVEKWTELVDYENMADTNAEDLARYGARDADLTLRLANTFRPSVRERYINEVLHDLQNALIRAELRGIRVNRELADQFDREIEAAMHDGQQRLEDSYGLRNPNSPKQVLELLLEMGVPLEKKRGKYSTSEDEIAPFGDLYPVVHDILEYRHLSKARGTYISNILDASERDGRYHPDFSIARTETGRLAEKLIALIPRAAAGDNPDLGRVYQTRMRELFIPDPGMVMVGADYSGLELVMAAYLSRDASLIDDIQHGRDTHSILAIQAFNLPVELEPMDTLKARMVERYEHQRTLAKSITFGFLFGSKGQSMTKYMSLDDAQQLIDALGRRYPGLIAWQSQIRAQARKGYVETPWGRRRHFYYDSALDSRVHEQQDRECINFPIQAQATDMNSLAFTRLTEMGYEMLFPFHDAIYMQVQEDKVERAMSDMRQVMENVLPGVVPFRVDTKSGMSWAEL